MLIGYCRSRKKEELEEQKLKLFEANCDKLFSEDVSGKINRIEFNKMIEQIRSGDTVIVTTIYVLPVTTIELISFLSFLYTNGIKFKSLRENFSNITVLPYLNSYQKKSRTERAMANLEKASGKGGRPKGLSNDAKKEVLAVAQLYKLNYTIDKIMEELKMTSRSQVYKRLREAKLKPKRKKIKKSE
jgi:DNA invertase Pin-like site-specific DNA recombinase